MASKSYTEKCSSSKFKRLNYFHGMLLTEDDFQDEQLYFREKLKLHNRLHGTGVVWGLTLKKECDPDDPTQVKLFIEPGAALDCAGNEIIVCRDFLLPMNEKIKELKHLGLLTTCQLDTPEPLTFYIGIKYCECQSEPAEQYTAECADDTLRPQYSRIREGFSVAILTDDEYNQYPQSETCIDIDCQSIPHCSENEMTVFLGTVENYEPETPDCTQLIVSSFNNPPIPLQWARLLRPQIQWERLKKEVLCATLGKNKEWINLSFLIGQKAEGIAERIKDLGLTVKDGAAMDISEIPDYSAFLDSVKLAQPWARMQTETYQGDIVTVYKKNKCIVFFLIETPAKKGTR